MAACEGVLLGPDKLQGSGDGLQRGIGQVVPGHEEVGMAADEHHDPEVIGLLNPVDDGAELDDGRRVEQVDRWIREDDSPVAGRSMLDRKSTSDRRR